MSKRDSNECMDCILDTYIALLHAPNPNSKKEREDEKEECPCADLCISGTGYEESISI